MNFKKCPKGQEAGYSERLPVATLGRWIVTVLSLLKEARKCLFSAFQISSSERATFTIIKEKALKTKSEAEMNKYT